MSFQYADERSSCCGHSRRISGFCAPNAREHQNQSVSQRYR
jgi:hypothetical protein